MYVKELAAAGIKAHAEEPAGYLESREISVLTSLLAVIDNPMQNIPLTSVLMSPMFMLTAEDMAQALLSTYEVEQSVALMDAERTLQEWLQIGLVE